MQLPALSSEQLPADSDVVPEVIGYASYWTWIDIHLFLKKEDHIITTFSVLIVVATKLLLFGFCYEILQQIRKHKINHKTHGCYYYYWGAQFLIVCTLAAVIYFELTKQRNKTALYIFLSSFSFDVLTFIVIVLVVTKCFWLCLKCIGNTAMDCCCGCFGLFAPCRSKCKLNGRSKGDVEAQIPLINEFKNDTDRNQSTATNTCPQSSSNSSSERKARMLEYNVEVSLQHSAHGSEGNLTLEPPVNKSGYTTIRGKLLQPTSMGEPSSLSVNIGATLQPSAENLKKQKQTSSVSGINVPPPLTLLFYCCPFCCCRCLWKRIKLYWLWCFPILTFSDSSDSNQKVLSRSANSTTTKLDKHTTNSAKPRRHQIHFNQRQTIQLPKNQQIQFHQTQELQIPTNINAHSLDPVPDITSPTATDAETTVKRQRWQTRTRFRKGKRPWLKRQQPRLKRQQLRLKRQQPRLKRQRAVMVKRTTATTEGTTTTDEETSVTNRPGTACCKFFCMCCWLAGCCFCKCECCSCWWCSACGIPFCTPLSSKNLEANEKKPCRNNICIKALKCCVDNREKCIDCMNNEPWEKCGNCWKRCWTVFANITSLIIFLAFVSYLSQAFPAIVISYYLSPTASLIRLGFFEVIIVVLVFEISYLLFLLDKCTWLCYYNKWKKVPEEIEKDDTNKIDESADDDESDEHKTFISQYIDEDKDLIYGDICRCNHCYYPMYSANCQPKCGPSKKPCCKEIKHCHCPLFTLTCIQIFTMLFITILSAILLFFPLNIVIQQTSGSDTQFKDILAIVPTIAINLFLLSVRQGNLSNTARRIADKANYRELKFGSDDPYSTAENGDAGHNV